ncbi:MAG: hypothetical protein NC222_06205 [Staphylococcus sp.]|nr:hypothetical protein [Staphylococcus sp.]
MWTRIAKPALKKKPKKLKKTTKRNIKTSPKSKTLVKKKSPKSKTTLNKTKNRPLSKTKTILKRNPNWPPTETSLDVYEELLDRGYNKVTFVARPGACNICRSLNGKTWDLDLFIYTTEYDAPLFSHTHPGSKSKMKVWDSTGDLPPIMVDYQGNMS